MLKIAFELSFMILNFQNIKERTYPLDLHFRYIQSLQELLDFKDKSAEDAKAIYE